jgi:hypothetical protein
MWSAVRTYSTTVGSAGDDAVLKLEVRVEAFRVQLRLAVEAVAHALPIRRCLGHARYRDA